ncbi:MAG: PAS domain S-box protein [Methanospirillum sp.]|uniref:PAS domain S-box protein n=1 Tax=Methanospirillum sp. TaxID=45200 RepID=UPI0023729567|nr:PAS domain S-box protein [Methanospirillum sp.]MDD1727730.1 PAS domain S-box protein [Methanospirillum sp.]
MIRVIAVDDEPAFAEILGIYLKESGDFEVITFLSPEKALDYISSNPVDAIISDYMMAELDGISFFKQVRSRIPDIPFLLLTGRDDHTIFFDAMKAGIDFIQLKSEGPTILFTEISQKIRSSVGKYRANQEIQVGIRRREMFIAVQRELMNRLTLSTTTSQASDACLTSVRTLAGCRRGSIHLINHGSKNVDLLIAHNIPDDLLKKFTFGDLHKVIFTGTSQFFVAPNDGPESLITGGQIPILEGDRVVGALSFIFDEPHQLPSEIRDTIEIMVSQLGNSLTRIISEEQVRSRQEELNELYVAMQELVMVIDMNGTILNVNPAVTRALGYQEAELIGNPIHMLYDSGIRDAIIFQFLNLTGSGSSIRNEFPFLARDGTRVPVETRGTVGIWGDQNVLFSISRDIHERLEAEQRQHENFERIQAILSSSTAQIFLKDQNLHYLTANVPFSDFVGFELKEVEGKTDRDLFSQSIATSRELVDRQVITENIPVYNIEEAVHSKNGDLVWLVSSKVPVHDQQGNVSGIVGTSLDITDLVRTRQELIHRDKILSVVSSIAYYMVRSADWNALIPDCLALLGQATEKNSLFFSRVISDNGNSLCQILYEWQDEKQSPADPVHNHEFYSLLVKSRIEELVSLPSIQGTIADIPEDLIARFGDHLPQSYLFVPVFTSESLWGVIGFVDLHRLELLPPAIVDSLITAAGIIGSVIDRAQTEELFHRPVERSLVGIYLVQDEHFMYINPRMSEILGYPRETLETMPFTLCFHEDDTTLAIERHHRVLETPNATDDYEIRAITADERVIYLKNLISQFTYQGRPAVIGSIMDITARKQSESGLRQSLHEKDILLREVHHRVKNNMQIIVSLLRMQSSLIDNPEVTAVLQESKNRILSMAMIHEKLYRTDNLMSINLLEYLNSLANTIISDFSYDESQITLSLVCDPSLEMTIDAGIPLGLITNELLTNTFKHGMKPDEKGTISITVVHTNPEWLDFTYRDSGKGLPEGFVLENCDSLGMQLIQNLVFQASGELTMGSDHGIVVTLRIPMNEGFITREGSNATRE